MCDKVIPVAEGVLTDEYPVLVTFLGDIGQGDTPNGIAAENAYKAFEVGVENFQTGTTITEVEGALNAFLGVWNAIPIPVGAQSIGDVIIAAVEGVLGLLGGSSVPVPTPPAVAPTADEIKAHQAAYISHATAAIQKVSPDIKITRLDRVKVFTEGGEHVGRDKFREMLKTAVAKSDPKYAHLVA
jgi:acyl transferase domain-containing protein